MVGRGSKLQSLRFTNWHDRSKHVICLWPCLLCRRFSQASILFDRYDAPQFSTGHRETAMAQTEGVAICRRSASSLRVICPAAVTTEWGHGEDTDAMRTFEDANTVKTSGDADPFIHPAAVRCDMVLHRALRARHVRTIGIGGEARHGVTSGVSCETSKPWFVCMCYTICFVVIVVVCISKTWNVTSHLRREQRLDRCRDKLMLHLSGVPRVPSLFCLLLYVVVYRVMLFYVVLCCVCLLLLLLYWCCLFLLLFCIIY